MQEVFSRILTMELFFYTMAVVLIPMIIVKINSFLHEQGDPTWKRDDRKKNEN